MRYIDTTPREVAIAIAVAQRRIAVFAWWWFPMLLAISGVVYAAISLAIGQSAETGIVMGLLGLALSGLGWLVTLGLRFSKKVPKPAGYIWRVEQAIRTNPPVIIFCLVLAGLIFLCTCAMVALPNFGSIDAVPALGMLTTYCLGMAFGMNRGQQLLVAAMKPQHSGR